MSRNRNSIPESAHKVAEYSAILPTGQWTGKQATIQLWEAQISLGYKSQYNSVPARWFVVSVPGERPWVRRATGRSFAKAQGWYDENVSRLRAAQAVSTVLA